MTRADVVLERAPSRVSPEAETGWPTLLRGPRCCGGVVDPHGSKRYPRESEGAPSLWPRSCGARVLEDAAPLPGGEMVVQVIINYVFVRMLRPALPHIKRTLHQGTEPTSALHQTRLDFSSWHGYESGTAARYETLGHGEIRRK